MRVALALALLAAGPAVAQQPDLAELADLVERSIERRDTEHAVFHGAYDWHSAVHAHWALLRLARTSPALSARGLAADRSLSPEGLAVEADALRGSPSFEMPYGRAWFLRLAIEFEDWSRETARADPERLRPAASQVAASLLDFYGRRPPDPRSRDYDNASWALLHLHEWFRRSGDADGLARVDRWIDERFAEPPEGLSFALDAERPDFFSAYGNWVHLLARTRPDVARALLTAGRLDLARLDPVGAAGGEVHRAGVDWSRAWAIRSLAGLGGEHERLEGAYARHVEAAWAHHVRARGDYEAYDHWVPQFAVYALTER